MKTELKPCPFCGTKPHPVSADLLTRPCFYYECENKTCHAAEKGWHDTEQEAIDAWNRRPIEESLQSSISELEGKMESVCHSDAHFRNETKTLQARITEMEKQVSYLDKKHDIAYNLMEDSYSVRALYANYISELDAKEEK